MQPWRSVSLVHPRYTFFVILFQHTALSWIPERFLQSSLGQHRPLLLRSVVFTVWLPSTENACRNSAVSWNLLPNASAKDTSYGLWKLLALLQLSKILCSALVLSLPDFSLVFELHCDASKTGVGEVLCQKGHPIAFYNEKLLVCFFIIELMPYNYMQLYKPSSIGDTIYFIKNFFFILTMTH